MARGLGLTNFSLLTVVIVRGQAFTITSGAVASLPTPTRLATLARGSRYALAVLRSTATVGLADDCSFAIAG